MNEAEELRVKDLPDTVEDHERTIHLNTRKQKVVRDLVEGDVMRVLTGEPGEITSLTAMRIGDLEYMIIKGYFKADGQPFTNRFHIDSTVEVY